MDLAGRPALPLVCSVLGIPLEDHHQAAADVKATAQALLALLRFAAAQGELVTMDEPLATHDRGTTHSKSSAYIANRDS